MADPTGSKEASAQQPDNRPDADGAGDLLQQLLAAQRNKSLPPVEQWHPEREGESRMRIDRDGRWFHDGGEIKRAGMVRVFASVLRLDDGEHFLVTPAERLAIEVEDAPFVVQAMVAAETGAQQRIVFTTNVGDHVLLDPDHGLSVTVVGDQSIPYVNVRNGLLARINRAVFYELVELGYEEAGELRLASGGGVFTLGALDTPS